MNRSIATWLLAGSLAASLSWNWKLSRPPACAPAACGTDCAAAVDFGALALDPGQRAALEDLCLGACAESDRLELAANALERELMASLAAPELDAERLREQAARVGALRQRSLEACVEGILGLRRLLRGPQLEELLAQCPLVRR